MLTKTFYVSSAFLLFYLQSVNSFFGHILFNVFDNGVPLGYSNVLQDFFKR